MKVHLKTKNVPTSILYKKWCESCKQENIENMERNDIEIAKNGKRKLEEEIEKADYAYYGETSRSANERGKEHKKDLEYFREKSHILKHIVMKHPDKHPCEINFRMKIVSHHKTSFERQLTEAVIVRRNLGEKLMNSKQEYNRCYIPKITLKKNEKDDEKDLLIMMKIELTLLHCLQLTN